MVDIASGIYPMTSGMWEMMREHFFAFSDRELECIQVCAPINALIERVRNEGLNPFVARSIFLQIVEDNYHHSLYLGEWEEVLEMADPCEECDCYADEMTWELYTDQYEPVEDVFTQNLLDHDQPEDITDCVSWDECTFLAVHDVHTGHLIVMRSIETAWGARMPNTTPYAWVDDEPGDVCCFAVPDAIMRLAHAQDVEENMNWEEQRAAAR